MRKYTLNFDVLARELSSGSVLFPRLLMITLLEDTIAKRQAVILESELSCRSHVGEDPKVVLPEDLSSLGQQIGGYTCVFLQLLVHAAPDEIIHDAALAGHVIFGIMHRSDLQAPWKLRFCDPDDHGAAFEKSIDTLCRIPLEGHLGLKVASVRELGACFKVNCVLQDGFCYSEACINVLALLWYVATRFRSLPSIRNGDDLAALMVDANLQLSATGTQKAFVEYTYNLRDSDFWSSPIDRWVRATLTAMIPSILGHFSTSQGPPRLAVAVGMAALGGLAATAMQGIVGRSKRRPRGNRFSADRKL